MIVTDKEELTKSCKYVSLLEAPSILKSLEEELEKAGSGVGLAANQIGIDARVCIIKYKDIIHLVNPEIVALEDLREFHYEGCLSFPGEFIWTKRYNEVFIKDSLHPSGIVCTGFEAVVVQHEIGHLNGETMHDYQIPRLSRNDLCWCGKKKYKKCHMGKIISA